MHFFDVSAQEALRKLRTSIATGLTAREAAERLREYGPNTIQVKGTPLWRKLLEPFLDVFVAVLLVAVAISFLHHAYFDAWLIVGIISANALIYYVQRFSTERILKSLMKKNALTVSVLRNGSRVDILSDLLVPGDVIFVDEGQKIPADGRVVEVASLRVDESQLTGESLPISKSVNPVSANAEIYERHNMVYQGSFVVGGTATIVVTATGNETEFGQIAALSAGVRRESPVQQKIAQLVQKIIVYVSAASIVAFLLAIYRGMEWTEALRFVIALAVSAVPEGLAIAITIVLALGMRRMAAKKALVRTMSAIETVGAVTTIATDKTGTLTKNKLTVQEVWAPSYIDVPLNDCIKGATNYDGRETHDPLDVSLRQYTEKVAPSRSQASPIRAFPFDQALAMSGNVWAHGETYQLFFKGAPEQILHACRLSESELEAAELQLSAMTGKGFRVIAFAYVTQKKVPDSFASAVGTNRLSFCGFVAVADVLRPEAKRAIAAASRAGVVVRMITGDHFETAYQIGRELGLAKSRDEVFDSRHMRRLSDDQLVDVVERTKIFSRVVPEDKFRILTVLKRNHITAMTGDGVNDVPALTGAHVGLAMGSGSQIAKDAGDIILLNDNFKSVVDAIAEGRVIYGNIKRMLVYLLATNTGEVLVVLGALVFGIPMPLVPVQILWVNLVTDSTLVIPLGLEPGGKRTMRVGPLRPDAPLLSRYMVVRLGLIAGSMALLTLGLYVYFVGTHGQDYARTIAFLALVTTQWASAATARSEFESVFRSLRRPSKPFVVGVALAIGLQIIAMTTPLAVLLHVVPITFNDLCVVILVSLFVPIIVTEIHKYFGRRTFARNGVV